MLSNICVIGRSFANRAFYLAINSSIIRKQNNYTSNFRTIATLSANQAISHTSTLTFILQNAKSHFSQTNFIELYRPPKCIYFRGISTSFSLHRAKPNSNKEGFPSDYILRKKRAKRRRHKAFRKRTRIQRLQKKQKKKHLKKIRMEQEELQRKKRTEDFNEKVANYLRDIEIDKAEIPPPTEEEIVKSELKKQAEIAEILPKGETDTFAPKRLPAYDFPWIYPPKQPKRPSKNRKRRFRLKKEKEEKAKKDVELQKKEQERKNELQLERQKLAL